MSVIAANARALKTSSGYGSSGTNLIPSLIAINGVPKNMSVSSGVVYNVYGGSVTVSSTGMGFSITTSKLPQDACITLATKIAKNTFEQTKINSGSAITGEVTTAAATQACSSDSNSITWTYSS
ncbi:type 4 pilus major pilin [Pseudomonas aeruginosa]|uniref:type 4 pilus major pilin n=1 Tax=Pseudomonas aeruginosa TaxID=287 RepID=UPI003312FF63